MHWATIGVRSFLGWTAEEKGIRDRKEIATWGWLVLRGWHCPGSLTAATGLLWWPSGAWVSREQSTDLLSAQIEPHHFQFNNTGIQLQSLPNPFYRLQITAFSQLPKLSCASRTTGGSSGCDMSSTEVYILQWFWGGPVLCLENHGLLRDSEERVVKLLQSQPSVVVNSSLENEHRPRFWFGTNCTILCQN